MAEQQAKQKHVRKNQSKNQNSGISFSPDKPASPKPKPWLWTLVWLTILGILGGMGTSALLWLVTLPPPPNCSNPSQLTLDGERLYCAREAGRSGELSKLIAGLNLVKQWDDDHPLQGEAQKLREEWSKHLFQIARTKIEQSDLKGAMAIISHIPKNTEIYTDVQKTVARWRKHWQAGEAIATQAQVAMKQQKWDEAYKQIALLNDSQSDDWMKRSAALAQQVGAEKQAWQALNQAKMAATGEASQLGQAIALSQQVPANTYANVEARSHMKQWSHKLLSMSIGQWKQGNTTVATALLSLPKGVNSTPEIAELFQFGGAYRRVGRMNSRWLPSLNQIWDLQEAIAAIGQVQPNSPFYGTAQTHQKNWQAQLKDLIQLQYATATAALGQRATLQLAIAQAKQVRAIRPRYGQAQTLISYWVGEIERIEDQPYLARAQQVAKSGQIPALKAAIAEASKIALGRSLRAKSQDLIAAWQDQIETIEDQPLLDQAVALSKQDNLTEAIAWARKIQPGRALYAKAQDRVNDWQNQLIVKAQVAADQPILDRANALANTGNWTAAIDLAAQIYSGRVLYGEAQDAIARWRMERDRFNNPRSTDFPTLDPNSTETTPSDSLAPLLPTDPSSLPDIQFDDPSIFSSPSEENGSGSTDETPNTELPEGAEPLEDWESRSLKPRAAYEGYYDQRYYQNSQ
ncbi:MAG: hypothetical protein HC772_01000 [Leptolyngbyaceae cyanobacterium CRU_2_3]|nr:hypothetical protein [Leptolyngbyaceae cyanobacterium CRU_2_3]